MKCSVVFQTRTFADAIMPDLKYVVKSYSNMAQGGCGGAVIEAYGNKVALFDLMEWLRCPVTIYDEKHSPRNWSYINSITIYWDNIEYGISLDTMSNDIAVAYVLESERKTTAWSSDTTSTTEYGEKELLLSRPEISTADALQLRDTKLQALKYPIPIPKKMESSSGNRAVIETKSWLDTMDWRYYSNSSGKESYEVLGSGGREIGEDDRPFAAMSFKIQAAAAWDATVLKVHGYKYPSSDPPVDNLVLSLYSDNGGNPNASLASVTVAAADIGTSADWIGGALSATVTLNLATTYHVHVARSGAVDADKYYMVDTNRENGYPYGSLKLYSTTLSAWVDRAGKGDMNFIVEGQLATTTQISNMITAIGSLLAGTIIDDASGVLSCQYRNGDNTGYYELINLLETGTTNDKRLLCQVTEERWLRVYEEPAKPTDMENCYKLDSAGNLYDQHGRPVDPSECTVGVWCALQDVTADSVELAKIANPSPFFIEEAEYDAIRNVYSMTRTKDQRDVWEIGGVGDE